MDTNAAPVVSPLPDNISASGARRLDAEHHGPSHTKKSIPSEDADDPLDGAREHSLRKETGQAAVYHERLDHAAARAAKHVDTPEKPRLKPVRRAGFGSMSACPIAAAARSRTAMRRCGGWTRLSSLLANSDAGCLARARPLRRVRGSR